MHTQVPRATRVPLPIPIMYRRAGEDVWFQSTIVNISETGVLFGPAELQPGSEVVLSFSEALAYELASVGIRVSVLCPGPTRTGFQQRAKMERSRLFDFGVMDADVVARVAYRGLKRNKRIIIPGIRNKVMAAAVRFAPRRLLPYIVMQLQKPHGEPPRG
jgi:NAD(P)-dependent dehydrogenase (short-subunit alcohol dehydrogenase family)